MSVFNQLDPACISKFEQLYHWASRAGLAPTITSARRSLSEQGRLYRKYLRGETPYGVAPPGMSMHNYGRAIDIVSRDNAQLAARWKAMGGTWGGPSDPVHFEI